MGADLSFSIFSDAEATQNSIGQTQYVTSTIYYRASLASFGNVCAVSGGVFTITTPDGVSTNATPPGGIPLVCGGPSCSPMGTSIVFSVIVPYTVRVQDLGVCSFFALSNTIEAVAQYTGGVSFCSTNFTCSAIATTTLCNPASGDWIGASGKWEDGANWSLQVPPRRDTRAQITNAVSKTVTIDDTTLSNAPDSLVLDIVAVSSPPGTTNALLLTGSGGDLLLTANSLGVLTGEMLVSNCTVSAGAIDLGASGAGQMTILNGTVLANSVRIGTNSTASGVLNIVGGALKVSGSQPGALRIGDSPGATGMVMVSAGELAVTNGVIGAGNDGTSTNGAGVGHIIVSNGTVLASTILLGSSAGGQGDLTIQSNGVVDFGFSSAGTNTALVANDLILDGGLLMITNGTIYCGLTHPGAMTMSNGLVFCDDIYVGDDFNGSLLMVNGTMSVVSLLHVGELAGSTGVVWITGGDLLATNLTTFIGNDGVGQMTISNGNVTAARVVVSNSSNPGTLSIQGGTLTADLTISPHGRFVFGQGQLVVTATTSSNGQSFVVGDGTHAATMKLLGGTHSFDAGLTVSANALLTGCGTISGTVVNQGTITNDCAGSTLSFQGVFTNSGTLVAAPGAILDFNGPLVNSGLIDASQGIVHFNSTTNNTGTILTPPEPTIMIVRPHDGMRYPSNLITIVASAAAHDGGAIRKIEFLVDGVKRGETTANPGTTNFPINPTPTNHVIAVRAIDTLGMTSMPTAVTITVGAKNSPLGDWEVTISGADTGVQYLTFEDDFSTSGFGIRLKTFGLNGVSGHWGFKTNKPIGQVTGPFVEQTDGTTNWTGSFLGPVKSLKSLSGAVPATNALGHTLGTFHWRGVPATVPAELGGTWTGAVTVVRTPAAHVSYEFSADASDSRVYDMALSTDPGMVVGQLLVTSRNKVYADVIFNGKQLRLSGTYSAVRHSLTLRGKDETAETVSIKLFQ